MAGPPMSGAIADGASCVPPRDARIFDKRIPNEKGCAGGRLCGSGFPGLMGTRQQARVDQQRINKPSKRYSFKLRCKVCRMSDPYQLLLVFGSDAN